MNQRTHDALASLGGGNMQRGVELLWEIGEGLAIACQKHPVFAEGAHHALGEIGAEYQELVQAVEKETPERQREEAKDVAFTALRFVRGDHQRKEGSA